MERPIIGRKTIKVSTCECDVEEAQRLVRKLVKFEMSRSGVDKETALERATTIWKVEASAVRAAWKRRNRKSVKSRVMDRLRQMDEYIEALASKHRAAIHQTADDLEKSGSRAAGVARFAADMVGTEGE